MKLYFVTLCLVVFAGQAFADGNVLPLVGSWKTACEAFEGNKSSYGIINFSNDGKFNSYQVDFIGETCAGASTGTDLPLQGSYTATTDSLQMAWTDEGESSDKIQYSIVGDTMTSVETERIFDGFEQTVSSTPYKVTRVQ